MDHGKFIIRQAIRKMRPFLPDAAADIAGATAFGRASVIRTSRSVSRRCASGGSCAGALCACGKEGPRHHHERAHRPGHAHAEVVGVLVLALTSVPREWAALLREEAATTQTRGARHRRLKRSGHRRCVQESAREAHCTCRHSALEPISKQRPAAQRLLRKLADALVSAPWEGRCGDAQVRERGQRGDRRRHAAREAVLAEAPAPQRARSARVSRPADRTGGGGAHSTISLVSAVMLARLRPMKPFLAKFLIPPSQACGRDEDGPLTRRRALALQRRRRIGGEPGRAKGAHMSVSAVSAEIVGGMLPEKRFPQRTLCHSVPVQHARVGRETERAAAGRTARSAG
jgi:hypothetical protein